MPSVTYDRTTGIYSRRDENINGNWGARAGITFNRTIDKSHRWRVENALWITYSNMVWRGQDFSDINTTMQRIETRHIKMDETLRLSFRVGNRFDTSLNGGIVHGRSWSDLSAYQDVRVTDFSYGLDVRWSLPLGFHLSSNWAMLHRSGYESGAMNNHSSMWNALFTRSVCHNRLTFNLIVHDILNRTTHNTWSVSSTGYTNTHYNSLPRYAMLDVIYKLHKAKP